MTLFFLIVILLISPDIRRYLFLAPRIRATKIAVQVFILFIIGVDLYKCYSCVSTYGLEAVMSNMKEGPYSIDYYLLDKAEQKRIIYAYMSMTISLIIATILATIAFVALLKKADREIIATERKSK